MAKNSIIHLENENIQSLNRKRYHSPLKQLPIVQNMCCSVHVHDIMAQCIVTSAEYEIVRNNNEL